jgi:hypothetical protein
LRLTRWRYILPLRLRSLLRIASADNDLDEELAWHLNQSAGEFVRKGMPEEAARLAARREF